MKLLLAGGGTGGHLFPAIAIAERLIAEEKGADILFVGTERGIEARVVPERGFQLETVDIEGFSGRGILAKAGVLRKLMTSTIQGRKILKRFKPDIVVGVGGYASAPMIIAAGLCGIPVVLHEQNAVPGLTNRVLGRWARKVCVSFENTLASFSNAELTGNPLRSGLEDCPELSVENRSMFIFGGSRGAHAINLAMCEALPFLEQWRGQLEIVHQTGEDDLEMVLSKYREAGWNNVEVTPFIDDMAAVYRRASLVLCRAGATTIAELTACGRPAILIPFPYASNDHQRANAEALAEKGAAVLVDQKDIDGEKLAAIANGLLSDTGKLRAMADRSRRFGKKGAAARILSICRDVVGANGAN